MFLSTHTYTSIRPILIKSSSSPPIIDYHHHPHIDGVSASAAAAGAGVASERRHHIRPISPLEESLGGPPLLIGSLPSRISPGPLCGRQRRIVELSSTRAAMFLDDDRTLTASPTNGASTPEPRSPRSADSSSPRTPSSSSHHHAAACNSRSPRASCKGGGGGGGSPRSSSRNSSTMAMSSTSKDDPLRTPSPRELTRRRSRELSKKIRPRADSPNGRGGEQVSKIGICLGRAGWMSDDHTVCSAL